MNRRKFLKRAAVGTVALGSLPALGGSALADDDDGGKKGYHFVVLSKVMNTSERLIISGQGRFDSHSVDGGGHFDHFRAVPPAPFPVVATGTWKAKTFVSFALATVHPVSNPEGRHGIYQAGILKMKADVHPIGGKTIRDVLIEVVCNLGPAGPALTPGVEEGVYVSVPGGAEFEPAGLGVTTFSTSGESGD
jgi:hypothetical protein